MTDMHLLSLGTFVSEVPCYVFYMFYKKFFIREWASKPQNLKKMLRKSPASIAWTAIFKNDDFS